MSDEMRRNFHDSCEKLGAELVRRSHTIVFGSATEITADPHVLRGANRVPGKHEVLHVAPAKPLPSETPYQELDSLFPNLHFDRALVSGEWKDRRVRQHQVQAADVVLLIGGRERLPNDLPTIFEIATGTGTPVVPIPVFGGTAERLWADAKPILLRQGLPAEAIDRLGETFRAQEIVDVLDLCHQLRRSRPPPDAARGPGGEELSAPTEGRPLTDLFSYLEEQCRSGELQKSLATELALEHKPDPADLRLREGYELDRTVTLLKAADLLLRSASIYDDPVEALTSAALTYTAILDATARSTEAWWPVHNLAYCVFTGVLQEGFGRRLPLDREAQRRLYEVAGRTAERLGPSEVPLESEATEPLLLLMKEFAGLLEE